MNCIKHIILESRFCGDILNDPVQRRRESAVRCNRCLAGYSTFTIAGGCHVPSPTGRIEGGVSFGQ
jgi:hypothetical protein